MFFDGDSDFKSYLAEMEQVLAHPCHDMYLRLAQEGTWGDEITLKSLTEAFGLGGA